MTKKTEISRLTSFDWLTWIAWLAWRLEKLVCFFLKKKKSRLISFPWLAWIAWLAQWLAKLARSLILDFEQLLSFCCETTFLFIFYWYFLSMIFENHAKRHFFLFFLCSFWSMVFEKPYGKNRQKTSWYAIKLSMIFQKHTYLL